MKKTSSAVLDEHMAVWLVRAAIETVYAQGNVVIVGRGGQAILHDKPGVFHVRIEAPLEFRVKWVTEHQHLGLKEAQQYVPSVIKPPENTSSASTGCIGQIRRCTMS